ncbi:unnamed protein product [Hermetia illucens]|uniref:Coronin n=1 Tax=Hermetia illucens TaxID=343691 RepID=A0A7R8V1Y9_HERIL|nr:coronin-7 isoform X2 [Hermetia illucens]CAD7091004.1 unnamed protein product [Hermetia illucens]
MAWRFKASKYKNAAPIVPKPEACIRDICVGSYQSYGNNIAASAAFMAFNWEHTGSSLAVLPIDDCGRKSKTMPLLHAHTDTIMDIEFSPFHDGLLATASQDCLVKIWHIPEKGLETSLSDPECTFSYKQRRAETVGFHPTADFLLYSTAAGCITLWDITSQKDIFFNNEHPETIQSLSWKNDGTVLATSCKDKIVRIVDPRSATAIQMSADSHQSIKDSRVVWLGEQNRILTTGFDSGRLRQVIIRDLRNFSVPEKTLELDCSTGILMPLFDPDTNMLFLAGKGDTTISYMEVTDKDPYLIEGLRHTGEQTKGACLVPKRALKVMEGEVNRVLQLTSNTVIPIMYQVPRKTYRDFHSDLYPETSGYKTELTADKWIKGTNISVPKISLDPAKRELGDAPIIIHRGKLNELIRNLANSKSTQNGNGTYPSENADVVKKDSSDGRTPYKVNVKKFENKYKTDSEKDEPLFKSALYRKHLDADGDINTDRNDSDQIGDTQHDQGFGNSDIINSPPKPLPRTSRTNSVPDYTQCLNEDTSATPRPRPRTTASAYKPRLGPKPFTSNSADVTFDKVFSVPQAPGSTDNEMDAVSEKKPDIVEIEIKKEVEHKNGDSGDSNKEKDYSHDDESKSLTTLERRKLFELNHSESSENSTEGEDKLDAELKRLTSARSSIAERRRLYENRSKSVQEDKPQSPVPLIRRESMKAQIDGTKQSSDFKRISLVDQKQNEREQTTKADNNKKTSEALTANKRTSTVFGKVSKYRHLKGTPGHKSTHIENLRNLSRQIPGECNGFHANQVRAAVPLSGPGGKIAIFELNRPGRLPDGVIPSLVNASNIMDFQWDPFDTSRLAVACDDGVVKIWKIEEGGLKEPTNVPEKELTAHLDKIYFIRFHPLAQDVLLTASYDMTIKLWDLGTLKEKLSMKGHTDQIFDFAWSPCGVFGATVCKDGKIRIFNPRKSENPIREGIGPAGTRGARITWAIEGQYLVVTGFDKVSERQISIYDAHKLNSPLNTVSLDVSPAILIPFYDEDSSTLFVTGKGDSTIYVYEITDEEPYICPLSHHRCSTLHQGLSFLYKIHCDVASVEFAKAYRLINNAIEPLSFTVPRIKSELFQDDLFPPTRVLWTPTMTAEEWFTINDKKPKKINLQPEGMDCLSSIQPVSQVKKQEQTSNINVAVRPSLPSDFDKSKQEDIQKAVSARMEYNTSLEQDYMEGVDANEWEE